MQLWAMQTKALQKIEASELLTMLPQGLQKSLCSQESLRQDALWAYSLLRVAVRDTFGMALPDIDRTANGKPYFRDYPEIFFNISHTEGAVLVGLSNQEIGVDIEKERPVPPRVQNRLQVEAELFFAEWVRWEACAKCAGKSVLSVLRRRDIPDNVTYRTVEAFPGYYAGAAAQGTIEKVSIAYIKPDALFADY